jgi:tetratricopeptide (TPR) repeat protein
MRSYPDHPAGYFFQAVVLDARMERHHSDAAENEFYRHCDLAITKGERMLEERPDDLWAKFFMAGANGAKGAYESRFERWITAFRHGWQGVSVFREILDEDPSIRDVCYGIGLYNYWRSAMTKMLWWMPGVEDKRDEAIAMMFDAMRNGQFVRQASAAELLPMLCNEGRYAKALRIADEMIEKYPRYLAFRWGRAEALLGLKRFAQAEQSCTHILSRLGTGPEGRDEFGLMLCNLYLARAYLGLGRPAEALRACKHMSSFTVGDALEKRAEDLLAEGEKIERSAKRALAR